MGVFTRRDSPFFWVWLEGAARPRVNTMIPIGATAFARRENRRLAERAYHALMADRARARFGLVDALEPRSFEAHRAWYAQHVSTQKRGTLRERSMLTQLGAYFDGRELTSIDAAAIREWRTWRLQSVTMSTVRREEAVLRHLLTTAIPKYLERHPLAGVTRLRVPPRDSRVVTRDEEQRVLAQLQDDVEAFALVVLALDTLLRAGNAAALTRPQDHGAYLFSDTKVDPIRIPISRRLRTALDALPMRGPKYFPRFVGQHNRVIRMFAAACKRAGVQYGRPDGVTFHSLRHTGATRMLEAGIDVKTVMAIGGWRSLRVLERYLHPTDEAARLAVECIGARRGGRQERGRPSRLSAGPEAADRAS